MTKEVENYISDTTVEPGILDVAESSGSIMQPAVDEYSNFVDKKALDELKHSIRIHLIIMNGPTQQLCSMLLKLPDILGDADSARRDREVIELAYLIIEGVALYVQRSIDERAERANNQGQMFPQTSKLCGDHILVAIGTHRSNNDKMAGKLAVLKSIAEALRGLSVFTKAIYPDIYDSNGVQL